MNQIETLIKQLQHYSTCYYDGNPIISDEEYDVLRQKLEELDPTNPYVSQVGSPTTTLTKGWQNHKHSSIIGSLNKITPNKDNKIDEEFISWAKDKGAKFIVTPKFDGSTIVATYKDGKLQTLATRGDGLTGENITANSTKIANVKQQLKEKFTGEIRGEAIILLSDFNKWFKPHGYKNARNSANGKVRDQKETDLQKHVRIMWFDIIPHDRDLKTEIEKWQLITTLLITKDDYLGYSLLRTEEIIELYNNYHKTLRNELDFEIDGLVVKVNDLELQESLGIVNNKPKGAIALKFPPATVITTLNDVVWQQGITGRISPVAILEPVDVGGVTISRASLCTIDEIERLQIAIGDQVIISRRNDVIPKIESLHSKGANRKEIVPPSTWNGDTLVRDGAYLITLNLENQGGIFGNLMNWIQVLKLKGFGHAVVRNLIENGVMDIVDFYNTDVETLTKASNSEKVAIKLHEVKESSRELKLSTFLSGLNIPTLGETNAVRLEKRFKNLGGVLSATVDELQEIQGIKTNAVKICNGLKSKYDLINRLSQILIIKTLDQNGPLAGRSVCITGDLSFPRNVVHDWVRSLGGEVKSSVSKDLTYLVTNDPGSGTSKNQKADSYGVPKITENQLYEIIGSKPK